MIRPPRLALAFLAADLALFGLLCFVVGHQDWVLAWDDAASAAVAPLRQGAVLVCFLWITALGTGAALVSVMVGTTILLAALRRPALILPAWLVFLGTQATVWTVKFALARPRPAFIAEASAASPSFPSAHAAASAAVWGFLAYLAAREAERRHPRVAVTAFAAATIALVGFSRVVLSVHYVTDVLGGLLVAAFWLGVGALATRALDPPRA